MKKFILTATLAIASLGLFAQSTAHTDISRWSLGLKGGMDFYRVSPDGDRMSWAAPTLLIEYGITPLFGMGLEAGYFNYDREADRLGDFKGATIDAIIYGSTNISNLVAPVRTGFWRNVNLYSTTGFGAGFYNYDLNYNTRAYGNDIDDNGITGVAVFGLDLAFNLGKAWELSLGGQYRYYTKNDLGGYKNATFGSDALVLDLGVRYKFNANKKTHVRNMTTAEYYPMNHVTNVKVDVIGDEYLRSQIRNLESELRALENNSTGTVRVSFHNVEFNFNSADLTSNGKQVLNEISRILKNNTNWSTLKVTGYTDNIGTTDVNQKMSENRASTVKNYLVSQGIPANKISTAGRGENDPIAPNNTEQGRQQNRRVEFEINR